MAGEIYQLLYVSKESSSLSDSDYESILRASRKNNARDNITGFLACLPNGAILQMLEGEKATVQQKYQHIAKDTRHKESKIVFESKCDERQFHGWSMGFRKVPESEAAKIPGYIDLGDGKLLANVGDGPSVVMLLKAIFAATTAGK